MMMKRSYFRCLVCLFNLSMPLLLITGCERGAALHDPTPWVQDFSTAQSQATSSGKPLFLNFTADWCPPCQEMKKKTFPDPAVQQFLVDRFVVVKIDLTNPNEAQNALSEQYGVQFIPTYIIASANGKPIANRSGFVPTPEFLAWLQKSIQ